MFHAQTIWVRTASSESYLVTQVVFVVVVVLDLFIIHVDPRRGLSDFDVACQGDRVELRPSTLSGASWSEILALNFFRRTGDFFSMTSVVLTLALLGVHLLSL